MADVLTREKIPKPDSSLTPEQFLEWLTDDTFAEWVDGKVIFMSPVSRRHQDITDFLISIMRIFIQTRQLGVLCSAPFPLRLDSTRSVREPDLMYIRTQNLDRLKDTYLDGPADIAVEIVSPESIGRDRGDKYVEYEQAGIPEYWLIDPVREQAEFYHLTSGHYHLIDTPDGIFHSTVLPDFWLRVSDLWQNPLPNPLDLLRDLKIL